MDAKEFKKRMKKLPKQSNYQSITRQIDSDGSTVWVEGCAVTADRRPKERKKRAPNKNANHPLKGRTRDPETIEKIKAARAIQSPPNMR